MSDGEMLWWGKPADSRRYHIFRGTMLAESLCGNWGFNHRDEERIDSEEAEYREGKDCKACCREAGVLDDE